MLLARRPNLTAWCKFYTYQRMFVFVFCYIGRNFSSEKLFVSLCILEHEYCFFKTAIAVQPLLNIAQFSYACCDSFVTEIWFFIILRAL